MDGPGHQPWWQITDMPWIAVCLLFFAVGTVFRNVRVGGLVAGLLALCGLLGGEYWEETALTVGMIVVAVLLCALIGIPVGIICGRSDGAWNAVRPVLDAMQVVHPFVYMLPIVFFFSIGLTPATMVTMVFALPPLIRLTNLGIRQVPADVVEASRAYGAPEWRVLADVQLPLARPAVMTGLNQTLLLSISMLGIAAIMGAGGLGLLVFRAIRNLDIEAGASSGLALYIVAVVLDRISQPESSDPENLLTRLRRAWAHRRDPESLLPQAEAVGTVAKTRGQPAPLCPQERRSLVAAAVGALVVVVAVFLPWGHDSGKISGHQRLVDTGRWEYVEVDPVGAPGEFEYQAAAANPLAGSSFNGFSASGGSFYGIGAFGFAALIIAAAGANLWRPGRGMRLFGSNGVFVMSVGVLAAAVAYLWSAPGPDNVAYRDGIGPWVALAGGALALVAAIQWLRKAPYSALTPLPAGVSLGKLGVAVAAVLLTVISGFAGWSFDSRTGAGIVPDPAVENQIEALRQQALEDPTIAAEIAQEISAISNAARRTGTVVIDGFVAHGSRYGYLTIGLAITGLGFTLPAAGVFGNDERRRRRWSAAVACIGVALMVVATAWIASLLRVADPQVTSGAGAFISLIAGVLLMASTAGVLAKFGRSQTYVPVDGQQTVP
ncbi:MAG: ABC transporter permease subunit [bacterium]|nr:ABC transporter permease subunit [bacterium]